MTSITSHACSWKERSDRSRSERREGVSVVGESADDFTHAAGAELGQRRRQLIDQPARYGGIIEVRRANLNGAGASDEELHHVVNGGDPADADYRNSYMASHPPDES